MRCRPLLMLTGPLLGLALAGQSAWAQNETDAGVRVLLVADQETTLASQLVGRVRAVNASLGSSFRKGDVLVSFDCDEQTARLKMAQADLSSAREAHDAKLRLQGLQSAGEVEVSLAASAAEKAAAQVAQYRAQQQQCTVLAPFDGRVVKVQVKAFQGVNLGQPLLDIISNGPLKMRVNVPSRWLAWLQPDQTFQVDLGETGKRYPAKVKAINAQVDAVSQTIELEGVIEGQPKDLLAGMSGTALFEATP
ncbi:RND family efflux transporter MFP subunit [Pseudomonas sp. SJZ085]|nr:RND family efflux transporter MFP subunit [Pseudomonas sp. SJZ075]TWC17809.1 RND family efflux transporter MFP subunit [Pseudomonas sp. SJZ074]TWC29680.1 RND family efflux transporter MFP subunit [Pseudomonas sp. SJZ078]TWC35727.1 RND family efflux transporter MFP subunit [Pseudomonas sp. SJZ085]TWC50366.1 RND family efflux transporter MFP subunit [Pseudomonas sp. SJZ124]TWC86134.1 RND family efflux transporter MFP subunit [Pseudomonas sp. SJZ101]